jgi:nicotinamidase-related amidase
MTRLPLLDADDSVLLLVDLQVRLAQAMPEADWRRVQAAAARLARGAGLLHVPVIVTRQYPRGLGDVDADVQAALPDGAVVLDKTAFSAAAEAEVAEALAMTGRSQVLVAGMEAHVCVLQSAAGLLEAGHETFVAADAICSRDPGHAGDARERLRAAGAAVTNTESALFEWLRDAAHPRFRDVSRLVK